MKQPTNKLPYKRVKIIWVDICSSSWCEDIGYLYSKDSKVVKIFTSFTYDNNKLSVGNITAYPRSVVKKIEVLK
jgi:hypothetical protein